MRYLQKSTTPMIKKKKRVASFGQVFCNFYEKKKMF